MKQHHFILLLSIIVLVLPLAAEKVNLSEAEQVVLSNLTSHRMNMDSHVSRGTISHEFTGYSIQNVDPVTDQANGETLFYVFHLQPEGFMVVSTDTALPPVIAYSYSGSFSMERSPGNSLLRMLESDMKLRLASLPSADEGFKVKNFRKWALSLNNPPEVLTVEQWPPVEHSQYNRGWLPVEAYSYDSNPIAQIDNYWQTVAPFCFTTAYDEVNPPLLPMDAADRGGSEGRIRGYDSTKEVTAVVSPAFFDTLKENMRRGWPASMQIRLDNGDRFYAIADGYRATALRESYYHLNFGSHAGIPTAWYALGTGFTLLDSAVLDIHPTADLYEPNNTYPEAYPIMDEAFDRSAGLWKTQANTVMKSEKDLDWYRFDVKAGDELAITSRVISGVQSVEVGLYKGTQLIERSAVAPNGGELKILRQVAEPGTYFISVGLVEETPTADAVDYDLHVKRERNVPDEPRAPEKVLDFLVISGPSSVDESSEADYTCRAYFEDGTNQYVTDWAQWSENSPYSRMLGNTLYTSSVGSNVGITVSASYNSGGVYRTAVKNVTIVNVALDHITITGSTSVMENSSASYTATAYFTNGTSSNVSASASWSENSSYASMSGSTLTTGTVSSHQSCTVSASYSSGGITKSDTHSVTILNFQLSYVTISGSGVLYSGSSNTYYTTAYFTDGSSQDVTNYASYGESLLDAYMAGNLLVAYWDAEDDFGTVWTSYSTGGVTKTDSMGVWLYGW